MTLCSLDLTYSSPIRVELQRKGPESPSRSSLHPQLLGPESHGRDTDLFTVKTDMGQGVEGRTETGLFWVRRQESLAPSHYCFYSITVWPQTGGLYLRS